MKNSFCCFAVILAITLVCLASCAGNRSDEQKVTIQFSRNNREAATEHVFVVQRYTDGGPYENIDTVTFLQGVTKIVRTYDDPFVAILSSLDSGIPVFASTNFIASFEKTSILIENRRVKEVDGGENIFFRKNRFLFQVPSELSKKGFDYRLLRSGFDAANLLPDPMKKEFKQYEQSILSVVGNMPNSFCVLNALNMNRHNLSLATLDACLKKQTVSIRKTKLWQRLSEYVRLSKLNLIGQNLRYFQVQNISGQTISNREVFSGKRYYYVDFWASWCIPCRRGLADLKNVIAQVDTTQVKFVFLSVDNDLAKWKNAVIHDNVPGYHVVDSFGRNGLMRNMFALDFIPQNYLINDQGKIIKRNMSPSEVMDFFKLARLGRLQ